MLTTLYVTQVYYGRFMPLLRMVGLRLPAVIPALFHRQIMWKSMILA